MLKLQKLGTTFCTIGARINAYEAELRAKEVTEAGFDHKETETLICSDSALTGSSTPHPAEG